MMEWRKVVLIWGILQFVGSFKLVRFGGAGIYFWWQAGAAKFLQENYDIQHVHLLGASAGAITTATLVGNGNFDAGAKLAIRQAEENQLWDRKAGLAGVWSPLIRSFLDTVIEEEELSTKDLQRIHIAVTPSRVIGRTRLLSNFTSKSDLVDAVMASVHIPVFMNGQWSAKFRDKRYVDGSLWSFLLRRRGPLPSNLGKISWEHDILDIKYQADGDFIKKVDPNNVVQLITPSGLYEMMDHGYRYMKKKHETGQLSGLSKSTLHFPVKQVG